MERLSELLKGFTIETAAYSLLALFVFLLLLNIPTSKDKRLSFLINALIVVVVSYLSYKYVPISSSVFAIVLLIAILISLAVMLVSKEENNSTDKKGEFGVTPFVLKAKGKQIIFNNPFRNFMVIGGSGSGKTKSHGKPLLKNYIQNHFAGFIYDMKDFDYTKSAYNLINKYNYPHKFYYLNFVDMNKSHRTNILDPKIIDENLLLQLISDIQSSFLGDGKKDEWFYLGLQVFQAVAIRFYYDYPQYCNLPTIVNYCVHNDAVRITEFVSARPESAGLASGFVASAGSLKTQSSILSSLKGYISNLAFNKKVCYVLTGNDFEFDAINPLDPKLICISNNFAMEDTLSPVIALMVKVLSRKFTISNKVNCVFFLDEATTFKIDGFEKMPSVLREYRASFVVLTQSTAKIERVYGELDKVSLKANFGNIFYGATSELKDIKDFTVLFPKIKEKRVSKSRGTSGNRDNRSTSVSHQDKERYEPSFFKSLKPGEFIGVTSEANVTDFHAQFKQYEFVSEEKDIELPIVRSVSNDDLIKHYTSLITLVKSL